MVEAAGAADDPIVRDAVAGLYVETEVYRHHMNRTLTRMSRGEPVGPEASLNKLYWSEMEVRLYSTGLEVMGALAELGPRAEVIAAALGQEGAAIWERWHKRYWYARAACIYAGTTQIQKNILAERVLGLPRGR